MAWSRLRRLALWAARTTPGLRGIIAERDHLRREMMRRGAGPPPYVPPGHFYSPVPDLDAVRHDAARLFGPPARTLPAIALREPEQLALLEELVGYYADLPFTAGKQAGRRYCFDNGAYSYADAIFLYAMLRHLRPRRMIEIGSGWSSCAALDTNDLFLDGRMACTFIEPHPEMLLSLLHPGDRARIEVVATPLQEVPLARFAALEAGDVLFVDSTHVSKIGSDVNRIFFEILPVLRPGVHVHFHDVFHPFEYPQSWIEEGRCWTEAYLLRAFLEFNDAYEIVLYGTFVEHFHADWFRQHMPLCLENPGGSIWIRRAR